MFSDFECDVMVFVFLRESWRTAYSVPTEKVLSMCRARDAVPLKDVDFSRAQVIIGYSCSFCITRMRKRLVCLSVDGIHQVPSLLARRNHGPQMR